MDQTQTYSNFLAPRYWGMWLALGMARLIAFLPLRCQHALGASVGLLAYRFLKRRRTITLTNLRACFPELSNDEVERLAKRSFVSNGIGLVEGLRSWFCAPKKLKGKVECKGLENLEQALARGRGVILLGAHYSTLDIAGSLSTLFFKTDVMQRAHSNGLFNTLMTRSRANLYGAVIDKHDIRSLVRRLKENHVVWYATDQDPGWKNTVFAPFFGVECANLTTTMRIAQKTGAAVVPFSHYRLPKAKGYVLEIGEPLQDFPSEDAVHDAARLNALIEQTLKLHPEQYLWMHRRFKTPVEKGMKNIYGQER